MAYSYLSGKKSISVGGCEAQIFFYMSLLGAECLLLAIMAYDRYVAICHPLQYPRLMSQKMCRLIAASSRVLESLDWIVDVAATLSFSYCGSHKIAQFCDLPALFSLSSMDTSTFETLVFVYCIVILFLHLLLIIVSYTHVILTVICRSSGEGRQKAFTTCTSHLSVVGMY
nr:olfactory receptor 2M3-like [Dasypus novemcinctus]